MSGLIRLAWRGIWRSRRRTLLTVAAITLATGLLGFFMSLQNSAFEASVRASMGVFQGHMQIQDPRYLDTPRIEYAIAGPEALLDGIRALPSVEAAAPRARGGALVSSQTRSYAVGIVGVDPLLERGVSSIPGLVHDGRFLDDPHGTGAVLGKFLAGNLGVKIGDELTLLGQGYDGSVAAGIVTVQGIFESGIDEFDRNVIEVPLETFREIFSMGDRAHSIVIRVHDVGNLDPQVQSLRSNSLIAGRASELRVLSWDDLVPGLRQAIQLDMSFGWLFYLSLVLVVTFLTLNTFLMSILERTREFGVMNALGMPSSQIVCLVITEAILLTVLGATAGTLAGAGCTTYFGIVGFQVPGSDEIMRLWGLTSSIHPHVTARTLFAGPLVTLCATLLSVLYPSLKLLTLRPVEALRAV